MLPSERRSGRLSGFGTVEHQRAPGAVAVAGAQLQSRIVKEADLVCDDPRICPAGAKCTLSSFQPIQM